MSKEPVDPKILEKIRQAKEDMAKKGRSYDGLGDEIDELEEQGPDLGPRNDIEYRKLIKEIRESGRDDDA